MVGQGEQNARRGILLMLAAVLLFAFMDMLAKLASAKLSAVQIAWGRYAGQALVLLLMVGPVGYVSRMRSKMPGMHLLRVALLLSSSVTFNLALKHLTLADANIIFFASPLLLTALSHFVLREKMVAGRWIAAIIGFVGVAVVMRPTAEVFQLAVLLPLATAVLSAFSHMTTPLVARTEDPTITLYYSGLFGSLALTAVQPWFWVSPSPQYWVLLAAMGPIGIAGSFMTMRAFQYAPASLLSPLLFGYLVWALFYGWLVFGEVPDAITWLGSALVITGGLYVVRTR